MPLDRFITAWTGTAYRHIPQGSAASVFDFRFAALSPENRWNLPGQPTLYLAGDRGVALAEFARHYQEDPTPKVEHSARTRQLYRLEVQTEALLDLRDLAVWDELSPANAPFCFLDTDVARSAAAYVRVLTRAQAMLVPSMAFLDDLSRWSLVVFLEKLPADPRAWLSAEPDEVFGLE